MNQAHLQIAIIDLTTADRNQVESIFDRNPQFEVVASVAEPSQLTVSAGPEMVAITDPAGRGEFDAAWLAEVTARLPAAAICIHTRTFSPATLSTILRTGVRAYCLKGRTDATCLPEVVALAADEASIILDEALRGFLRDDRRLTRAIPPQAPTHREVQVLELVARGFFDDEVGRQLGTSPNTVHNQVHSAVEKLGARNREQAVLLAVRYGLIDPYAA